MNSPYVQKGRLYMIPVIRFRLNFSLLVRRVFAELKPEPDKDLIAIAFPPSIDTHLQSIVEKYKATVPMPISLCMARWKNEVYQEVFPVTPTDGLFEAYRIAREHGLSIACIDKDFIAGMLINKNCMANPDLPDDSAVLKWGVKKYEEVIENYLQTPPNRFDPIDTWREEHIAEEIRKRYPYYERILLFCEFTHRQRISLLLDSPSSNLIENLKTDAAPVITVVRPNPEIALKYLDDFPKLVEEYENFRSKQRGKSFKNWHEEFDKLRTLFHQIKNCDGEQQKLSIRAFLTINHFIQNMLKQAHKLFPNPQIVKEVAEGCMGIQMANRLLSNLGQYTDQIERERIKSELRKDEKPTSAIIEQKEQVNYYLGRSCGGNGTQFLLLPPLPKPNVDPGDESGGGDFSPNEQFIDMIAKKLSGVITNQENNTKSIKFNGCLERGIDVRRTLRSNLSHQPAVYVKKHDKRKKFYNTQNSPIVFILTTKQQSSYSFRCTTIPNKDESKRYVYRSSMAGDRRLIYESEDKYIKIYSEPVLGQIYHYTGDFSALEKKWGADLGKYIPDHDTHIDNWRLGHISYLVKKYADAEEPWWNILLLTAIEYAVTTVICVVPETFRTSPLVKNRAREKGITLLNVHLSRLGQSDIEQLSEMRSIHFPESADKDKKFKARVWDLVDKYEK